MGNNCWGLGIICTCLMMMSHKCVSVANLTTASCSEQERLALLKFKDSVKDVNGMLSSWGVGNDCCKWERVGCEDATGRVVGLNLRSNAWDDPLLVFEDEGFFYDDEISIGVDEVPYLVGDELNSCLAELVNLRHLDLSWNDFQNSRIPEFIGSLKQLRYLNLSSATFSGSIPHQIGNLSNLKVLDLSNTKLIGNIPHEIGNLSNLQVLDLSYTQLIGNIPYEIGNLSNLEVLDLSGYDQSGSDSQALIAYEMTWITGLSKLKQLGMNKVDLSRVQNLGTLLYTNPSLLMLRLSSCGLSMASLSSRHLNSTRQLARIKHLDLSANYFQCQLPSLFQNMTSLTFLDLSSSYLRTSWSFENLLNMIPSVSELRLSNCGLQKVNLSPSNFTFSKHSSIQHLDLSGNEIEGRFPSILANMSSLISLDVSYNSLNSSIPIMPNLLKLDISSNNFRHIDDVGIWRQCHLKELICSSNNLEGEITSPSTNVSECSQIALGILNLRFNKLTSSIPESLLRFTNLKGLDLSSNDLTGPIPKALGKLRSLQRLDLSHNRLIGPIPKFHGQLAILHLDYNHLRGSIPESLGRLTTLTGIYLESNRFTGPIPTSLGRLTSLRVFSMASNLLNETIPKSIGQLTKLNVLDVSNNSLQGTVTKDQFANLSKLKYLDASYNSKLFFNISREWIPPFQLKVVRLGSCKFEDGFPQWFRTQRKLRVLVMSNASISGHLPTWLRLMPVIHVLDLSHNKLTGPLTNLPLIRPSAYWVDDNYTEGVLLLQNNLFKGLIPRWLCSSTGLQVLDISRNRLTGKIPKCLWDMSLEVMLLGSNKLSGVIPSSYGNSHLKWLQLNDNNLNGKLPQQVSEYFKDLIVLDLGENRISGSIPEWIGEYISSLNALRLRNNNFTGRIPHSLCKCKKLRILDLAHNNLAGSIPQCFGELNGMTENSSDGFYVYLSGYVNMIQVFKGVALDYTKNLKFVVNIDLSSNRLVGEVPKALTMLDALVGLNLSNNLISGGIPTNIGNLKSLNSLDLSANGLTGMIPRSMAALNFLSYLNLSHNNLSGPIPTGNQLQTLTDPSMYADNPYLCGAPLLKECFPHERPPTTRSKDNGRSVNEPKKVWFYLDITCGFATGFWGIIGVLLWKKQWRHKLFIFSEKAIDKIYVAVAVRVLRMKRGREAV